MPNILSFITSIFAPASKLIDDVHLSKEEKLQLKNELERIQGEVVSNAIELQKSEDNNRAKVMVAEANSEGWLTRSWRPICMLTILALVLADYFGMSHKAVPDELFEVFKVGLVGIGGGRSVEKVTKYIMDRKGV